MKAKLLIASIVLAFSVLTCAPKAEPFFFIQVSDTQLGFGDTLNLSPSFERMAAAVDKINELKPDFVIMTGDNMHLYNNEEQTAAFDSLRALIEVPVHYLPGNHDQRLEWEGSYESYMEKFGYDRFAFMHKGTLFIGINSNFLSDNIEEKEAEQYQWIVENLDKYGKKAKHIIMAMHCPIAGTGIDEKEGYSNFHAPYRQKYLDLCENYNIDLVLSGHRHRYCSFEYKNTLFVSCPGCGHALSGAPALPHSPESEVGINVVKVTPEDIKCQICTSEDAVHPFSKMDWN